MARLTVQVRQQLQALIAEGLDDVAIAETLKLTQRTVVVHRQRLLAGVSGSPIALALHGAITSHWRKLAEAARQAETRLGLPLAQSEGMEDWSPALESGGGSGVMFNALRKHLRGDERDRPFAAWDKAGKKLEGAMGQALDWARSQGGGMTSAGHAYLLENARSPRDPDTWLQRGGRELTTVSTTILARASSDAEVEAVDQHYQRLLAVAREEPAVAEFIDAWNEAKKKADALRETLWELGQMDGFPGECRLCPIALMGRRPR